MRTWIRLLALFTALVTAALWFFGGPNLGWTKTSVPLEKIDEVTAQRYIVWEARFLPGVEFLAGGLCAGLALWGVSFCFRPAGGPR